MDENTEQIGDVVIPPLPPMRRIVLKHTTGPYAGLRQIVGHLGAFGGLFPGTKIESAEIIVAQASRQLDGITTVLSRHHAPCRFTFAFERYLLYEEVI